jgi:hypothetical protein
MEALVRAGAVGDELAAILVCIGALQVTFYVLLRDWPFQVIAPRTVRVLVANAVVIAGGWVVYVLLGAADLAPASIGAAAGSVVAARPIIGMLFEGWLDSPLGTASVTALAAPRYVGLQALAHIRSLDQGRAGGVDAHAGLNAIGVAVIMHVAIGRRWPSAALTRDARRG